MKENVGVLQIENKVLRDYLSPVILTNTKCILYLQGALKLVDVPGHERVRQRFFDTYKTTARGIVFVLDSFSLNKDIRDVAEYTIISMTF